MRPVIISPDIRPPFLQRLSRRRARWEYLVFAVFLLSLGVTIGLGIATLERIQ